ncbi:MAG: hypothetical protein ACQEXJ_04095 [Myxococcota bacterium]
MPRYEILFPGESADALRMTFHVEADNWMAALHIALEELGQPYGLQDALCEIQGEDAVRVTDPKTERTVDVYRVGPGEDTAGPPSTPPVDMGRALQIDRPRTRVGPIRRDTQPYILASEGGPRPADPDHTVQDTPAVPEPSSPTEPRLRETSPGAPISSLVGPRDSRVRPPIEALAGAAEALDDERLNAEQLIDQALQLAWDHVMADSVQCLLPESDGEGWRVVGARGERAGTVLLTRIVFDQPPLSSWAPHLDRALHVESPDLRLHFEDRRDQRITLEAHQVLMIPVRREERRIAMLLFARGVGAEPFRRDVIQAVRDLGDSLGAALALRL